MTNQIIRPGSSTSGSGSEVSELITRDKIPQLPYDTIANVGRVIHLNSDKAEKHNATEDSIDPFDTSDSRVKKSLDFVTGRKSSMSSLRKKKSVRFDDGCFKQVDNSIELQSSIYDSSIDTNDQTLGKEVIDCGKNLQYLFEDEHEESEQGLVENCNNQVPEKKSRLNGKYFSRGTAATNINLDITEDTVGEDINSREDAIDGDSSLRWAGEFAELEKKSFIVYNDVKFNEELSDDENSILQDHEKKVANPDSLMEALFDNNDYRDDLKAQELMTEIGQTIGINDHKGDIISSMTAALTVLKDQKRIIAEKDLDIASLVQLSDLLKAENDKFNDMKMEIQKLQNSNYEYQQRECELNARLEKCQVDLHKASRDNTFLENNGHELESKLILAEVSNKSMSKEIERIYAVLKDKGCIGGDEDIIEKMVEIFDEKRDLENEFIAVFKEREEAWKQLGILTDEKGKIYAELKQSKTTFLNRIEELDNKNCELQLQISHVEQENSNITLKDNIEQTRRSLQLEIATQDLESLSIQLDLLKQQLVDKETELNESHLENYELQCKIFDSDQQVDFLKQEIEKFETNMKNCNQKLNNMTIDHKLLKNDYDDLCEKCAQELVIKEKSIEKLNIINDEKAEELVLLNKALDDMRIENKDKADLIISLTTQLGALYNDQSEHNKLHMDLTIKYDRVNQQVEKLNKNLNEQQENTTNVSTELSKYIESNSILLSHFEQLTLNIKLKLEPLMYEESIGYMTQICKPFKSITIFNNGHLEVFKEVMQFIYKALEDLVENYLANETLLEKEFLEKNQKYNEMLNELSHVMITTMGRQEDEPKVKAQ